MSANWVMWTSLPFCPTTELLRCSNFSQYVPSARKEVKFWTSKVSHKGYEHPGRDQESLRVVLSHVATVLIEGDKSWNSTNGHVIETSANAWRPVVSMLRWCWVLWWWLNQILDLRFGHWRILQMLRFNVSYKPWGLIQFPHAAHLILPIHESQNENWSQMKTKATKIKFKNVTLCKWDIWDTIML